MQCYEVYKSKVRDDYYFILKMNGSYATSYLRVLYGNKEWKLCGQAARDFNLIDKPFFANWLDPGLQQNLLHWLFTMDFYED
jgi:hypothetical protein